MLGVPTLLREDEQGAAYEVLDTTYVADLLPGLRIGAYGASFRFKVLGEDVDQKPNRSTYNPLGLPERTIREATVMEFGPVTFPAYEGATAGVRSLTDWWLQAAGNFRMWLLAQPRTRNRREAGAKTTRFRRQRPSTGVAQTTANRGAERDPLSLTHPNSPSPRGETQAAERNTDGAVVSRQSLCGYPIGCNVIVAAVPPMGNSCDHSGDCARPRKW